MSSLELNYFSLELFNLQFSRLCCRSLFEDNLGLELLDDSLSAINILDQLCIQTFQFLNGCNFL